MRWKRIQHNSQSGAHSCERITNCTGEKPSYRARGQHTQAARAHTHTHDKGSGKRYPRFVTLLSLHKNKNVRSPASLKTKCVASNTSDFSSGQFWQAWTVHALCPLLVPSSNTSDFSSGQFWLAWPAPSMPFSLCLFLLQRCLSAEQLSTCRPNPIYPVQLTRHPLAPTLGLMYWRTTIFTCLALQPRQQRRSTHLKPHTTPIAKHKEVPIMWISSKQWRHCTIPLYPYRNFVLNIVSQSPQEQVGKHINSLSQLGGCLAVQECGNNLASADRDIDSNIQHQGMCMY